MAHVRSKRIIHLTDRLAQAFIFSAVNPGRKNIQNQVFNRSDELDVGTGQPTRSQRAVLTGYDLQANGP